MWTCRNPKRFFQAHSRSYDRSICLGTLLDINGFYDRLIDVAGAGAMLPITNFGHSLVHSCLEKANEIGYIGIFTGIYGKTSAGIAFTILISVLIAFIFKPKR